MNTGTRNDLYRQSKGVGANRRGQNLRKSKGRNPAGTFAALPHAVMDSEDFRSLSGGALKVLLGLLRQYRGVNNGDLSATFASASEWGIGSKATLAKA